MIDGQDFTTMTDSPLILSTECPNDTISIYIHDDDVSESMESFSISLYFVGAPPPRVMLKPSTATVIIADNDGRCCLHLACMIIIKICYFRYSAK